MLNARVVDHDVDVEVCHGVQVGQVGDHGKLPDLVGDGLGGGVTVQDRDLCTGLGEAGGNRPADCVARPEVSDPAAGLGS